jgi:transposase
VPLIFFEDEGRFGRISNLAECWAPRGTRPLVPRQVVRESLYAFAAVAPLETQMYWQVHQRCNTTSMSLFVLGLLEAYPDRRLVMFLDGAGWHRSKKLPVPERMRLESLPAYTPETNPVEHIWDELREKKVANRLFATLEAVEESIKTGLEELCLDTPRLAGITRFPWLTVS